METFKILTDVEINTVNGGTYYGNGVYCDSNSCYVDWNQAWSSIGQIAVNGWIENGPLAH